MLGTMSGGEKKGGVLVVPGARRVWPRVCKRRISWREELEPYGKGGSKKISSVTRLLEYRVRGD